MTPDGLMRLLMGGVPALANGATAVVAFAFGLAIIWFVVSRIGEVLGETFRVIAVGDRWLIERATFATGTRYQLWPRWLLAALWIGLATVAETIGNLWGVLAGLVIGLVFAYLVVRHWVWDQDERATGISAGANRSSAARSSGDVIRVKHIDVDVNLTWEVVVAVAALVGLAAMGFERLDEAQGILAPLDGTIFQPLFRSAAQILGELPESMPITDAAGVLRNGNLLTGLKYNNEYLKFATLALRIGYELFLVTAAFRIVRLIQRQAENADLGRIERRLHSDDAEAQSSALQTLIRLAVRGQVNAQVYLGRILTDQRPNSGGHLYSPSVRCMAANGLWRLGETKGLTSALFEAVEGYRSLLNDYSEKDMPADWATTQNNFGAALASLGERLGGEAGAKRLRVALKMIPWALT